MGETRQLLFHQRGRSPVWVEERIASLIFGLDWPGVFAQGLVAPSGWAVQGTAPFPQNGIPDLVSRYTTVVEQFRQVVPGTLLYLSDYYFLEKKEMHIVVFQLAYCSFLQVLRLLFHTGDSVCVVARAVTRNRYIS